MTHPDLLGVTGTGKAVAKPRQIEAQDVVLAPGSACLQVTRVSPVLEPGMASAMRWQLLSHRGPTCEGPPLPVWDLLFQLDLED